MTIRTRRRRLRGLMLRLLRWLVFLVLCAGAAAGVAVVEFGIETPFTRASRIVPTGWPAARLNACRTAGTGLVTAELTVTNIQPTNASYFVTVGFLSADGKEQYSTKTFFVNDLGPGQRSEQATTVKAPVDVRCKIVAVD